MYVQYPWACYTAVNCCLYCCTGNVCMSQDHQQDNSSMIQQFWIDAGVGLYISTISYAVQRNVCLFPSLLFLPYNTREKSSQLSCFPESLHARAMNAVMIFATPDGGGPAHCLIIFKSDKSQAPGGVTIMSTDKSLHSGCWGHVCLHIASETQAHAGSYHNLWHHAPGSSTRPNMPKWAKSGCGSCCVLVVVHTSIIIDSCTAAAQHHPICCVLSSQRTPGCRLWEQRLSYRRQQLYQSGMVLVYIYTAVGEAVTMIQASSYFARNCRKKEKENDEKQQCFKVQYPFWDLQKYEETR